MSGSHAGRPSSWLTVIITVVGFILGGVALTIGPNWPLFWGGCAVVVIGGVIGLAVGIMSDVVLDKPRVLPEVLNYSATGSQGAERRGGSHGETAHKPTRTDTEEHPHG